MLFSHHEAVHFLGKYPRGKRSPAEGRYWTHGVGEFLTDLIEFEPESLWEHYQKTGFAFESEQSAFWKRSYLEHIQPILHNGQVPIWSLEKLCMGTPKRRELRARRIVQAFGECKILVVLREPLALIESLYFQRLKASQLSRVPDQWTGHYYEIETWLEENFTGLQKDIMGVLDYGRTIQWFSDLLGPERICVLLFEDFVQQPSQFLDRLSQFCGIDSPRSMQLMIGERRNVRWTHQSISRLKWVERVPFGPTIFRRLPRQKRARYLGVHNDHPLQGEKARAPLSSAWIDRISDACRTSNRWLHEEWSLPLAKHGYPL